MEGMREKISVDPFLAAREVIDGAEEAIAKERAETGSSWFDCFRSVLTGLQNYSYICMMRKVFDEEKSALIESRLEAIESQLKNAEMECGNSKEVLPPERIREELLGKLNIFD